MYLGNPDHPGDHVAYVVFWGFFMVVPCPGSLDEWSIESQIRGNRGLQSRWVRVTIEDTCGHDPFDPFDNPC